MIDEGLKINKLKKRIEDQSEKSEEERLILNEKEKNWLDEACLKRYLIARDWSVSKTWKMLHDSLLWRRSFQPQSISINDIKSVHDLGTTYVNGFDKMGRPIIYMKPGAYNPNPAEQKVKFLVWVLEKAIRSMDKEKGVEKMCWILDFSEYGSRAKSPDGLQVAKESASILSNNYPERLGSCFIINSPWYFSAAWVVISPFLAPATKKKIHWVSGSKEKIFEGLSSEIDGSQLEEVYGGSNKIKYDPAEDYRKVVEWESKEKEV